MNITHESSRNTETQDVKVTLRVSGAEPRLAYPGGKRMWRPERIQLTWTRYRVNDGPWTPWRVEGEIDGRYVRKDGAALGDEYTEYANVHVHHLYGPNGLPEEFADSILATRPNGDLPAYFRRTDDVARLDA